MGISAYDQISYAQYKPISMQEMWAPAMQMREQHDKLQEEYSQQELLGGAASLGLQEGIDDKALADNKAYMDATKAAADELATKGFIDSGRRRQLIELKNQYAQTVLPIQNALKVRQEAIDFDRKMKAQDQTYRSTFDPSRVAVTDYLKNNQAFTPQGVSVGIMSKDAANEFAQLKNLVSQKYPTIAQSGVIGTLWTKVNSGVSMDEIAGFIKNEAANKNIDSKALSALGQEMHNIVENNLQKHGAYKAFGNDPKAISELRSSVANMAIYSLGDPKFGQMNDPMAVMRAQQQAAATVSAGKSHQEFDASFNDKEIDRINNLLRDTKAVRQPNKMTRDMFERARSESRGAIKGTYEDYLNSFKEKENLAQKELFKQGVRLGVIKQGDRFAAKDIESVNEKIASKLKEQYKDLNKTHFYYNTKVESQQKFESYLTGMDEIVDSNGDKINKDLIFNNTGGLNKPAVFKFGKNGPALQVTTKDGENKNIPFDINKIGNPKLSEYYRVLTAAKNYSGADFKRYFNTDFSKKEYTENLMSGINNILAGELYSQTETVGVQPGIYQ